MISINARAAGLGQFARAVTQAAGGTQVTASFPSLKLDHEDKEHLPAVVPAFASHINLHKINISPKSSSFNLNSYLFNSRAQAIGGIGVSHQYRFAHTDVQIPDYSSYKRDSNLSVTKTSTHSRDDRRAFTYVATAGIGVGGVVAAKHTVQHIVNMLSPARDCLALSKVEVNIGNIPEGKNVTVKWRGKPIFIRHRTQKEIDVESKVNISELRDPEEDSKRAPNPKWLIVIGICTHLGCVPIAGKGDFGGYYCPCHGSHYDASGRIRKGPAPYNLEVPAYEMNGDDVVIG